MKSHSKIKKYPLKQNLRKKFAKKAILQVANYDYAIFDWFDGKITKKYELSEIIKGDSIFCATGITSGDLVSGIKIQNNEFISETLVTHKNSGIKKVIKKVVNK